MADNDNVTPEGEAKYFFYFTLGLLAAYVGAVLIFVF